MTPSDLISYATASRYFDRQVRRVTGIELEQARRLQEAYARSQRKINAELREWSGTNTFTEARLNFVLSSVGVEMANWLAYARREAKAGTELLLDQSTEDTIREFERLEQKFEGSATILPRRAIVASLDENNYLMNRYESTMENYSRRVRTLIQQRLTNSIIERKTNYQAAQEVDTVMREDKWRVARIVRTEMHNIYSLSKILNFRAVKDRYVPDLMKGLIHPMDHRTAEDSKRLASINPIIDVDDSFVYTWKGERRKFFAPPDRPNDRAILIPVRGSWFN